MSPRRYGWVPEGTIVQLTGEGTAAYRDAQRERSGSPQFTLSADRRRGEAPTRRPRSSATAAARQASLIVARRQQPQVGDAIRLGTDYVPLTDVEPKGGDVYLLSWTTAIRTPRGFTGPAIPC